MNLLKQTVHLWQLEWLKMKHYTPFKVMLALYALALPGVGMSVRNLDMGSMMKGQDMLMFPSIWKLMGYAGHWVSFFILGFLALQMLTQEYSNRTLRQNIINGVSRERFWWSKVIFMLSIAAAASVYYVLCCLVFGFIYTDTIYASRIAPGLEASLRFFLMCSGYLSMGLLFGYLVRRTGLAIFLFFGYIMFIEPIVRWAFHMRLLKGRGMLFYPANAIEELMPLPYDEPIKNMTQEYGFSFFLSATEAMLVVTAFVVLMLTASWYRLRGSDL